MTQLEEGPGRAVAGFPRVQQLPGRAWDTTPHPGQAGSVLTGLWGSVCGCSASLSCAREEEEDKMLEAMIKRKGESSPGNWGLCI